MIDLLNNEHKLQKQIRPRNVFTAFILSVILPGFGQIYNGELKKGILLFALYLLNPLLFGFSRATTHFYGFAFLILTQLFILIYIIVDAVKDAKRQRFYMPKTYNSWYYQLSIAVGMFLAFWAYDAKLILGILAFHIPTPSNLPTIEVGDRIIADMEAYKKASPNYGDIVVFRRQGDQIYSFRIVGLPNDTLEIVDNILIINGKKSKSTFIKDTIVDPFEVREFEEEFPNGQKHLIYKLKQPFDTASSNVTNIIVPDNSYYLMGDNRDNAADSRYEGVVKKDKIIGRIIYSYWGHSAHRINLDFRNN